MHISRNPIDIIIPIYNAYDDLKKCIESIRRYTNLKYDRLICINDCSTDERIKPYLEQESLNNIIFLDNEVNQGFSNNVNKGMKYSSDRDVILLNSDTIVTSNWIDKIWTCAYSKPEIGTVTPLSNCATLCSVPVMCQDNLMPNNVTIDEFAQIIERCSLKRYPRITVAVGFCMFIKRDVINDVGMFDAETFEKGYGEENDFCNRAEQLGYIHVMCDDTFIYHKGTASFISDEKQKLMDVHAQYLEGMYPEQMHKNHLYCVKNPDQYIRDNINLYLQINNGRKNILMLSHLDFHPEAIGNVGGTQFHVRDLTMGLCDKYNIFVMAWDGNYIRLTIYTDKISQSLMFYIGETATYYMFRNAKLCKIFSEVLDAFEIDIVHIHHTQKLSFDLFFEAYDRGIPIVASIHDFAYVCPNVNLVNQDGKYCSGECKEEERKACLKNHYDIASTVDYLPKWRRECKNALELANVLISPSKSAREIFGRIFPELLNKIQVIEHASEIKKVEQTGVIGKINIADIKQSLDIVAYKQGILVVEGWSVLENCDSELTDIYVEISCGEEKNYIKCIKKSRPDVAKNLGSDKYLYGGFACKCVVPEQYDKVKIRVVLVSDGVYYTNDARRKLDNSGGLGANKKRRKIAFLGGLSVIKGARLAYEVITKADTEKYEWHIMGDIGFAPLFELEQDNLIKYGRYNVNELYNMFNNLKIDLVCIWSIWPETFCYTLSEAVECGIPVLGCDIGAVGERIKENGYGWTISPDTNASEILDVLEKIFADENDYACKKTKVLEYQPKKLSSMLDDYETIYRDLHGNPKYKSADFEFILQALNWANHKDDAQQNKVDYDEYQRVKQELEEIRRSRSYRYTERIMKALGRR